jgi:hypothetical protein
MNSVSLNKILPFSEFATRSARPQAQFQGSTCQVRPLTPIRQIKKGRKVGKGRERTFVLQHGRLRKGQRKHFGQSLGYGPERQV